MSPLVIFVLAATLFACSEAMPNREVLLGGRSSLGSFKVIEVIVVVDTAALMKKYPSPSKNHLYPTAITHEFSYMMASYAYVISHQASADLHLKAKVGDTLRFTGISESNNLDNGVIVYNITAFAGNKVASEAIFMTFEKDSVKPIKGQFPKVEFPDKLFWPIQMSVNKKGKMDYKVFFALYNRPESGDGKQKLFGYFEWDPTITVPV